MQFSPFWPLVAYAAILCLASDTPLRSQVWAPSFEVAHLVDRLGKSAGTVSLGRRLQPFQVGGIASWPHAIRGVDELLRRHGRYCDGDFGKDLRFDRRIERGIGAHALHQIGVGQIRSHERDQVGLLFNQGSFSAGAVETTGEDEWAVKGPAQIALDGGRHGWRPHRRMIEHM